jgi:Glycosyl transferase family 2
VVVLDDASTDDTDLAVRVAAFDARLRYCRRQTRLGRVGNYRRGLEQDARGAFVLMLDGDDYLTDPGFISTAMAALTAHDPTPVFVQAGHRVLYRPAATGADWALPHVDILPEINTPQRLMSGAEYLHFVYATGFFTHLGSLYARQSALEAGFYQRDISSSDMDSLLRLALRGQVLVLNTVAGCWVQHGGNASQNLPLKNVQENAALFREIAHSGAAVGLVDLQAIEPVLTRYEARTLAHLFQSAVGKSARGLGALPRMLGIALAVNPRVLGDAQLRRVGRRVARSLARLTWDRWCQRLARFVRSDAHHGGST